MRRQLSQAERALAGVAKRRDVKTIELHGISDHRELTRIGDELAVLQDELGEAEEIWLTLAAEAEDLGLDVST